VGGSDRPIAALLFAWAVVDLLQIPLVVAVFLFGMLLDPRREAPPERVWALGSAVAIAVFWAVPVFAVSRFRRRAHGHRGARGGIVQR